MKDGLLATHIAAIRGSQVLRDLLDYALLTYPMNPLNDPLHVQIHNKGSRVMVVSCRDSPHKTVLKGFKNRTSRLADLPTRLFKAPGHKRI